MRDFIEIGCSPHEEDCAQVGSDNYMLRSKKECRALINQLIRVHGEPPGSASLRIKSQPHDFGSYLEVYCYFDDSDDEAMNYAYDLEAGVPDKWDQEALDELQEVNV